MPAPDHKANESGRGYRPPGSELGIPTEVLTAWTKWFGPTSPTGSGGWPDQPKIEAPWLKLRSPEQALEPVDPQRGWEPQAGPRAAASWFCGNSHSSSSGGWNSFLPEGWICGGSSDVTNKLKGTTASPLVITCLDRQMEALCWADSCSETILPLKKWRLRSRSRSGREQLFLRLTRSWYIIFIFQRFLDWRGGRGVFIRESRRRFE